MQMKLRCLGCKHVRLKMSLQFASVFKTMINVYGELPSTEEEYQADNILREQQLFYERNTDFTVRCPKMTERLTERTEKLRHPKQEMDSLFSTHILYKSGKFFRKGTCVYGGGFLPQECRRRHARKEKTIRFLSLVN